MGTPLSTSFVAQPVLRCVPFNGPQQTIKAPTKAPGVARAARRLGAHAAGSGAREEEEQGQGASE